MRLLLHGATLGGTPEWTDLIEAAGGGFAGVELPWAGVQVACRRLGSGGFARRLARLGLCVVASGVEVDAPFASAHAGTALGAAAARLEAAAQVLRGLAAFGVGVPLLLVRVEARPPVGAELCQRLAQMAGIATACGLRLTLDVFDAEGAAAPCDVAEVLARAVPAPGIGVVADSVTGPAASPLTAFARLRAAPDGTEGSASAWASSLYRGGYRGSISAVAPPPRGLVQDELAAAARGLAWAQGVLRRAGI